MTTILFIVNAVAFGIGLAMDAFSVSLANGLNEPDMSKRKMCLIAGTFCIFQTLMPLIGWLCVHTIAEKFTAFQKFIPWIALALLLYIGSKMIIERNKQEEAAVGAKDLLIQGVATSIDALSVGFTIAGLNFMSALSESVIIGIVTFAICTAGLILGKKVGNKISGKANILGGCILILIGIEIFITGVF